MFRWIITKDRINETKEEKEVGSFGLSSGADQNLKSNPVNFSLYDDDKVCYFEGILYTSNDAYEVNLPEEVDFSPLDSIGASYGCTGIKHNGKWV